MERWDGREREGHSEDEPAHDGGEPRGFAGHESGTRQHQRREKNRELDDRHKEEASRIHGGVYETIRGFVLPIAPVMRRFEQAAGRSSPAHLVS